jgi:drug/metabolite transporter (DMT)-like permease
MPIGVLAGLATGALWGLTFVAPRAVAPFSAWDLTVARYGIFGVASLILMIHPRFRPRGLSRGRIVTGLILGGACYVGYFVSAAYAVRLAGPAIPPLVIGVMPVLSAIIDNFGERGLPWRELAIPLSLIVLGLAIVNVSAIASAGAADRAGILLGGLSAGAALAIWLAYGLANAAVMRGKAAPDSLRWTSLQGIGAALGSLFLLPFVSFGSLNAVSHTDSVRFAAWAIVMGLAGSWAATWFWSIASRRLPLGLSAQLIVTETIFGMFYGFVFEARWPTSAESIGAVLQVIGVSAAIMMFSQRAAIQSAAA